MVAYTGGPMRVAGWRYPVVVDLAGMAIPSQNRPIRFGHDAASGVGHTDQIRMEDGQLLAAGVVSRDTAAAKEVVVSARNGFPWQASIATSVDEFEFVKENQHATVNGREFPGPLNVVRKSVLGEISFVDLGADGQTSAVVAAQNSTTSQHEEFQAMETTVTSPETPITTVPAKEPVQAASRQGIPYRKGAGKRVGIGADKRETKYQQSSLYFGQIRAGAYHKIAVNLGAVGHKHAAGLARVLKGGRCGVRDHDVQVFRYVALAVHVIVNPLRAPRPVAENQREGHAALRAYRTGRDCVAVGPLRLVGDPNAHIAEHRHRGIIRNRPFPLTMAAVHRA